MLRIMPIIRFSSKLRHKCHCIRIDLVQFGGKEASQINIPMAEALKDQPTNVALDFSRVKHIDSAGIEYLVRLKQDISAYGGNLVLYNVNSFLYRLLEMTQVTRIISIHRDNLELARPRFLAS